MPQSSNQLLGIFLGERFGLFQQLYGIQHFCKGICVDNPEAPAADIRAAAGFELAR